MIARTLLGIRIQGATREQVKQRRENQHKDVFIDLEVATTVGRTFVQGQEKRKHLTLAAAPF